MNVRRLFYRRPRNKAEFVQRGREVRRMRPAANGGTGRLAPAPLSARLWHAVLGTWAAVLRTSALLAVATLLAYVFEMTFAVGPLKISAAEPCNVPEAVHVPAPVREVAPQEVSPAVGDVVRPAPPRANGSKAMPRSTVTVIKAF